MVFVIKSDSYCTVSPRKLDVPKIDQKLCFFCVPQFGLWRPTTVLEKAAHFFNLRRFRLS